MLKRDALSRSEVATDLLNSTWDGIELLADQGPDVVIDLVIAFSYPQRRERGCNGFMRRFSNKNFVA